MLKPRWPIRGVTIGPTHPAITPTVASAMKTR
jgi:hypothetical protein